MINFTFINNLNFLILKIYFISNDKLNEMQINIAI